MKSRFRLAVSLIAVLVFASCSYGILNFSSETADLGISFEIYGDNALGVDRVDYEMIPPDGGAAVVFTSDFGSWGGQVNISNITAGKWTGTAVLFAGDTEIQSYDYTVEIITDSVTQIRFEASYLSGSYYIQYNSWQDGADGTTADPSNGDAVPGFTFDGFSAQPEIHYNFRSESSQSAVRIFLNGSGFEASLNSIEILYPDGGSYFYGYSHDYYNRNVVFTQTADDSLITLSRLTGSEPDMINGSYTAYLDDYNGSRIRREYSIDYVDIDNSIPKLTGSNGTPEIPKELLISADNEFSWSLADGSRTGTILLYVINRDSGWVYPDSNAVVVTGTSGTFIIPAGELSGGSCEIIVAAFEYATTTPYDDAFNLGLSPNLRSEGLIEAIRSIYGEQAGFIRFSSAQIEFLP